MIWNSMEFLMFFLPVFLLIYGVAPRKIRNLVLLAGSFIFYSQGDAGHLPLLLGATVFVWIWGKLIWACVTRRKRKGASFLMAVGAGICVSFLLYCKTVGQLPLGISFYTFQAISYLADVRQERIGAEKSWIKTALHLVMFPKLLSGPLMPYGELESQWEESGVTAQGLREGLGIFTLGLASKVLLADRLGILWNDVRTIGAESISTPMAWLGAMAFSLKLYFDFYGYSKMAVGVGKMLGFTLPDNFRHPYMATSIRDFYRRWHISLGKWFTQYVYIPMGGSKVNGFLTVRNLFVVWLLTAVWHGMSPNYLMWGGLLFLCIASERLLQRKREEKKKGFFSHIYVLFIIPITWVCFAITDLTELEIYLGRMLGLRMGVSVHPLDWLGTLTSYGLLLAVGLVGATPVLEAAYEAVRKKWIGHFLVGGLFWLCVWRIVVEGNNTFMYLHF